MRVTEQRVFEDGWREQINTIGKGSATVFQNGTAHEVTWQKKSKKGQITFTDAAGKDLPLASGQTWITAIPNDSGAVSWQ
jgi:hypothetical protein